MDDDDAPILTPEMMRRARPAGETFSDKALSAFKRSPGRPKADRTKTMVSLRLDPEVLDHYRATGPGWQSRINAVLLKEVRKD